MNPTLCRVIRHRQSAIVHLVEGGAERSACGIMPLPGGWVPEPGPDCRRATCRACPVVLASRAVARDKPPQGAAKPLTAAELALVDRLAAEWPHVARILAEAEAPS